MAPLQFIKVPTHRRGEVGSPKTAAASSPGPGPIRAHLGPCSRAGLLCAARARVSRRLVGLSLLDAHAHGIHAEDEPTYDVRFNVEELWPNSANKAQVNVGVFESYLEKIDQRGIDWPPRSAAMAAAIRAAASRTTGRKAETASAERIVLVKKARFMLPIASSLMTIGTAKPDVAL